MGASNVSKVPTATLLYAGATTKIYAHFMPWFGGPSHMNVGYSSNDAAQVNKQVTDMMSRAISGMIIDWYGPGTPEDATSLFVKQNAETRNGQFEFAIMEDAGALNGCGGNCTQALINHLNYVVNTYEGSPAYMRWNGRPVVFFFGVESLPVDWNAVRSAVPQNPIFIFENVPGFNRAQSGGAFSWAVPEAISGGDPIALGYLNDFYNNAVQRPGALAFGTGYKGFDDRLAAWTKGRQIQQDCGATWVNTLVEIGKHYSATNQLAKVQLVTWNDYEEGSEIETGIDNCMNVNASVSGSTVSWSVSGSEATLDHYTVFISSDGQNLMSLGDLPIGTHSLDLAAFGFSPGGYKVYVKAVGKPSIVNHISAPANFNQGLASMGGQAKNFVVAASQSYLTIAKGNPANFTATLIPQGGDFGGGNIALSCSGLPAGASCAFSQSTVNLRNSVVPVKVTLSSNKATASNLTGSGLSYALAAPAFGTVLAGLGGTLRRRSRKLILVAIVGSVMLIAAACGGGGSGSASTMAGGSAVAPPAANGNPGSGAAAPASGLGVGTYKVMVIASAGGSQQTTNVSVTVQ